MPPQENSEKMMTSAITFKLVKFERALTFQIIYQNPSITNKEINNVLSFQATNGIKIVSSSNPHICADRNIIWIFGYTNILTEPSSVIIATFESDDDRDEFHDKLLEAFAEWKYNNYFQPIHKDDIIKEASNGIYNF